MEEKSLRKIIGERLRAARIAKDYNQSDLAEYLGMKKSGSYGHIEAGRNLIKIDHLIKLAKYLGEPLSYFLGLPTREDLQPDEEEALNLFRSLPKGHPRDYALLSLRSMVQHEESRTEK